MDESKFSYRYTAWVHRHSLTIALISALTFFVGGFYTVQLYKNLHTDVEELLPESAPSVQDLKKAQGRVTALNHLEIVVQSANIDAAKRFQIDLTRELQKLPAEVVSKVKSDIRPEREFFDRKKLLYLDLADWKNAYDYVKKKAGRSAFDLGLGDDEPKTKFDPKKLEQKYKARAEAFDSFQDDLFQSKDHKTRIILAFMPGKVTNIKSNQALSDAAKEVINRLNPKSYAPDLVVGLGGDVQNLVEEHHGLVHDLISSFVIVTILCTVVLLLFFQSVGAVFWLTSALFVGVSITFGLSYYAVGYLNANTAFLGSIVIGNGINVGVILLARYQEERIHGGNLVNSMATAIAGTVRPTLTAALAAGFAYGSLILTHFRGFNQFGVIGAIGMVSCWITAYTSLPAFLFLWERRWSILPFRGGVSFPLMPAIARLVDRFPGQITYFSLALAVVALLGVAKLSQGSIESDLSKLRNRESMEHGSGYWGKKVDEVFGRTLTPTVVLTESPVDTKKLYGRLKEVKGSDGIESPFSQLNVVEDFLPAQQSEKLELMDKLKKILTPSARAKLSADERKWVDNFLPETLPTAITAKDLPKDLLMPFEEANGSIGHMVHVYPRLNAGKDNVEATGTWNGEEVIRYTELLRQAIHDVNVPAVIAGQPPISADMLIAITRDGPRATLWAFLAVLFLVVVMFPNIKHSGSIILSLLFGVLLMLGAMGFFQWKINFLNFITLPITFGIGVDYAVNVFGRFYEEKRERAGGITRVIRSTGGAVVLCSSTTIIGYGSLLLSGSQAFVSFGHLAVLGEFACIFAAVISMPAIWIRLQRTKSV